MIVYYNLVNQDFRLYLNVSFKGWRVGRHSTTDRLLPLAVISQAGSRRWVVGCFAVTLLRLQWTISAM